MTTVGIIAQALTSLTQLTTGNHRTVPGTSSGYFIMLIVVDPIHHGQPSPRPGVFHKYHVSTYNNEACKWSH